MLHKFKYLGTTVTDLNFIHEKIKSRLNSGNSYYHSVENILSPRMLYKNVKINMYETGVLPVVLYGCKTWSLTLRDDERMELFQNRVLRRLFGPKWNEIIDWRKLFLGELHVVLLDMCN
jgi:hypothetical protein